MSPAKVSRERLRSLTDLPNIGKACAEDLRRLGITCPEQLRAADPYALYEQLCIVQQQRVDPCMLDVFISITRFMDGGSAQPWWAYTAERKATLAERGRV
jgi:hypothetical protein